MHSAVKGLGRWGTTVGMVMAVHSAALAKALVTPAVATPGLVTLGLVTPAVVTPAVVTPGLVTPHPLSLPGDSGVGPDRLPGLIPESGGDMLLAPEPSELPVFPRSVQRIAQADHRQIEANRLLNQGIEYTQRGQFREAIAAWEQALALYRQINSRAGEAAALGNLGIAYRNLGQYERAISFAEQHLTLARDLGDRSGQERALGNLGAAYINLGQYQRAIGLIEQALQIAQAVDDRGAEGRALANLGVAYDSLGQYQRAIAVYEQALAIADDLGDRHRQGLILNNLGSSYDSLGRYSRSLDFYEQALAIARDIDNRLGESLALNNLGVASERLGQYDRSLDFYQQALAIARQIGSRADEALTLGNLGSAYGNLGQYDRAIDVYQQALALAQAIGDRATESAALGGLGNLYRSLGDHEQSASFHAQDLAIARDLGDRASEARALGNLGNAYLGLNQPEQALDFYGQQLAIARDIGNRSGEGRVLYNIGNILNGTGRFAEAEGTLKQAIEIYESLRIGLSDAQLISLADNQSQAYANLEIALIAQDKITEALVTTERGRAQAFALQLARRQGNRADVPITVPAISDIQRIAREQNATLVSYSLIFDVALYIWVVSPAGDIQFRAVNFDSVDATFNAIATIDGPVYRGDERPAVVDQLIAASRAGIGVVGGIPPERLKDLHQVLIDPIVDLLPTDPEANVVFIPQGSLFLVPFAALQDETGTHLIAKHTLTTAPSIQVLGLTQDLRAAHDQFTLQGETAVIVGNPTMPMITRTDIQGEPQSLPLNPLPGAQQEAEAIARLLNASVLIGDQATEAQVKQRLANASLIHLATHGLLDYREQPLAIPGALALTPGGGEDGFLTVDEILALELQAQLAILSACDTGRGEITGDGVVGLSRALITAGVPSVVVSLWAVPDSPTALLMTEFYRQLSQGQTKAQALRQAMLMTMAQHPDPRNWAAFTLIGANE